MMTTMKSVEEIQQEGYTRGKQIAMWIDTPFPQTMVYGVMVVDLPSAQAAMYKVAVRAEEQNRTFPEFELTRYELNTHETPDEAWDAFALGVVQGIKEQCDAACRAVRCKYEV